MSPLIFSIIAHCHLFTFSAQIITSTLEGPRICYSRASLALVPGSPCCSESSQNRFYHQLWCPRFRDADIGLDRRRCHTFGYPSKVFVSACRSTLGIGVVNARSLNQKQASIHDCFSEFNPDVLAVTETWHLNDQDLVLRRAVPSGYTCLAVGRAESDFHIKGKMATDVRGGGAAVIHKDCWKSRMVNFPLKLRSFEFLCVRIDVKPTSILVVNIYRLQPIYESFFQDFKKLLERLVTFRCPVTVVEDFNIHLDNLVDHHTVKFN